MKNLFLYLGVEYNEEPYPVLFKKMCEDVYSKKEIIEIGKKISVGCDKITYLAGFDKKGKIKVAYDFQNGDFCGELSLEHFKYIVL